MGTCRRLGTLLPTPGRRCVSPRWHADSQTPLHTQQDKAFSAGHGRHAKSRQSSTGNARRFAWGTSCDPPRGWGQAGAREGQAKAYRRRRGWSVPRVLAGHQHECPNPCPSPGGPHGHIQVTMSRTPAPPLTPDLTLPLCSLPWRAKPPCTWPVSVTHLDTRLRTLRLSRPAECPPAGTLSWNTQTVS